MASNITVEQVHIETYENTVINLAQQMTMRTSPWVMFRAEESGGHNWETLDSSEATDKTPYGGPTGRNVATPEDGTAFGRRRSIPITSHKGETVEPEDIVKTLIDPKSSLAQAQVYGLYRRMDDEVFDAVDRDADDGNGGTVALPAGQKLGDGTASISFDLVTQALEVFDNNDVDEDERKVWFISPAQKRKLFQLTENTSADYNSLRPLEEGKVAHWMGCDWVVSNRLNSTGAGKTTNVCMTSKAVGFNINEGINSRVAEDPTISFAWRVYCRSTFGAVRVQDAHCVTLDLSETI